MPNNPNNNEERPKITPIQVIYPRHIFEQLRDLHRSSGKSYNRIVVEAVECYLSRVVPQRETR